MILQNSQRNMEQHSLNNPSFVFPSSTNEYIPVSADTIPVPVPVVVVTTVPVTTTTTTSADTVPVNKISKNLSPYVLLLGVAVGTIILTKILKNEKG
jgi:hypothetical protein